MVKDYLKNFEEGESSSSNSQEEESSVD